MGMTPPSPPPTPSRPTMVIVDFHALYLRCPRHDDAVEAAGADAVVGVGAAERVL